MKARISLLIGLIALALFLGFIIFATHEAPAEAEIAEEASGPEMTPEEWAAVIADNEKGLFILVDKEHPVTQEYIPADLSPINHFAKDRTPEGRFMRTEAAGAFDTLCDAATAAGYEIVATTAYRSYDFQASLFSYYVNLEGQEWADINIAPPGTSEHQTGLAADCSTSSVAYELVVEFGDTPEGIWLGEHAHSYGFIIRYPKDRQDITGFTYEPWHIRYVGTAAATFIHNNDLTLEEFLQDYFTTQ